MKATSLVLLLVVLSGCASQPARGPGATAAAPALLFSPGVSAYAACHVRDHDSYIPCYEASVAADQAGRIFVANSDCRDVAVSLDGGGTFTSRPIPGLPVSAPPVEARGDCTLETDGKGRLFFAVLAYDPQHGRMAAGIQVARSDDAGSSWTANAWLGLGQGVLAADRPWLAFDGDTISLAQWDYGLGVEQVFQSVDGGATWTPGFPLPTDGGAAYIPFVGNPSVRPSGTHPVYMVGSIAATRGAVHVPSFDFQEPYAVRVTSSPNGRDFTTTTVFRADQGGQGAAWPTLAADGDALYLAWVDGEGAAWVATRPAGTDAWSAPVRWTLPDENLTGLSVPPKIVVGHGTVSLLWYAWAAPGLQEVRYARASEARLADGPDARAAVAQFRSDDPTTDFASLALLPDGRAVAAWTDPTLGAAGLRVAVESRPITA